LTSRCEVEDAGTVCAIAAGHLSSRSRQQAGKLQRRMHKHSATTHSARPKLAGRLAPITGNINPKQ
jgi:hypothetical protein